MPELPKYLFKFRDWDNKYHRRILTHKEIFFSSIANFNDPFDSAIPVRYDNILKADDQKLIEMGSHFFQEDKPNITDDEILAAMKTRLIPNLKNNDSLFRSFDREVYVEKINNYGVFTTAAVKTNILLWAHYANSHKGICVCFDAQRLREYICSKAGLYGVDGLRLIKEIGKGPDKWKLLDEFKVNYMQEFPFLDRFSTDHPDIFSTQFFIKSNDWEYEQEYRYVIWGRTNMAIELRADVIKAVILGLNTPESHQNGIREALIVKFNSTPQLFKSFKRKNEFGLEFAEVKY